MRAADALPWLLTHTYATPMPAIQFAFADQPTLKQITIVGVFKRIRSVALSAAPANSMSVGLTGMWAPLEDDKRKADDDDAAERDAMQVEMPAASAGRGEQPASAMRCAAAVWPGAAAVFASRLA